MTRFSLINFFLRKENIKFFDCFLVKIINSKMYNYIKGLKQNDISFILEKYRKHEKKLSSQI